MLLQLFLATLPQPPSRTSVRPTALLDWLAARGGGWSVDLSDQTPSGSRGLLTTRPAETGAVLLEVPLSATLMDAPTDDEAVEDAALLPTAFEFEWAIFNLGMVISHGKASVARRTRSATHTAPPVRYCVVCGRGCCFTVTNERKKGAKRNQTVYRDTRRPSFKMGRGQ